MCPPKHVRVTGKNVVKTA